MSDTYYVLKLDDPAKPGFCSFDKIYIGTEETINIVANNLEKDGSYPETVKAIRSYFKGNHSAEHNIAYQTQKALVPVKVEAEHKILLDDMQWTHTNIWGFPYEMKCDSATIHQIVFKCGDTVYRCVRAWLENLCYMGLNGGWSKLNEGFWGNYSILNVSGEPGKDDFTFNNLLYVVSEQYENDISIAESDIYLKEKIELKGICDEIFADG